MALKFSTTDRTAFAAQLVAAAAGGSIKFFSGAITANCAAADPTGLLATGTLPSPALTAAAGVASKAGTWTLTGSAAGTIGSFRIYDGTAVCRIQGIVSDSSDLPYGPGDMIVDNISIAIGQVVTVSAFSITMGNA